MKKRAVFSTIIRSFLVLTCIAFTVVPPIIHSQESNTIELLNSSLDFKSSYLELEFNKGCEGDIKVYFYEDDTKTHCTEIQDVSFGTKDGKYKTIIGKISNESKVYVIKDMKLTYAGDIFKTYNYFAIGITAVLALFSFAIGTKLYYFREYKIEIYTGFFKQQMFIDNEKVEENYSYFILQPVIIKHTVEHFELVAKIDFLKHCVLTANGEVVERDDGTRKVVTEKGE